MNRNRNALHDHIEHCHHAAVVSARDMRDQHRVLSGTNRPGCLTQGQLSDFVLKLAQFYLLLVITAAVMERQITCL